MSSILLGISLLIISILSLFIGVMDIDLKAILSGGSRMELNICLFLTAVMLPVHLTKV